MSIRFLAWLAATALALQGCSVNADTEDGPVEMPLYDIVTFQGNTAPAGGASFELVPNGDMDPVMLEADRGLDPEQVEAGSRVVIGYYNEPARPAYTSGRIRLRSAGAVNGSPATAVAMSRFQGWDRDPVYVEALWRAGEYINLRSRIPYSTAPRLFALLIDRATLDSPNPHLYLAHALADTVDRSKTYAVANYASFSIDSIWNLPSTQAITVHVANSHLPDEQEFTFVKQ